MRSRSSGAEQPDQPVAQVFPLKQDEDRDDQHDAQGRDRRQCRPQGPLRQIERGRRRLVHLYRHRPRPGVRVADCVAPAPCPGGRLRAAGRRAKIARELGDLAERRPLGRLDLVLDLRRVARHVVRQVGDLRADETADAEDDAQRQQDRDDHRRHTWQPRRCSRLTSGARTKDRRTASVIGIRMSRAT